MVIYYNGVVENEADILFRFCYEKTVIQIDQDHWVSSKNKTNTGDFLYNSVVMLFTWLYAGIFLFQHADTINFNATSLTNVFPNVKFVMVSLTAKMKAMKLAAVSNVYFLFMVLFVAC